MDTAEIEARLEKLRRLNRERVNRWRARHPERAVAQQRKRQERIREALALYNERRREQPENAQAVERTERQPEAVVSEEDFVEKTYEDKDPDVWAREQHDTIAANQRRAGVPAKPQAQSENAVETAAPQSGGSGTGKAWDAPGSRTEHEAWVQKEAERFVAKKAAQLDRHRRRAGVRTPLDS